MNKEIFKNVVSHLCGFNQSHLKLFVKKMPLCGACTDLFILLIFPKQPINCNLYFVFVTVAVYRILSCDFKIYLEIVLELLFTY